MVDEQPTAIRDPKRLRALAHPLRFDLLDLLSTEGAATATRCAQVLGQSVANCSYHLNTLAKAGFVEHAPGGEGREKPWRVTSYEQHIYLYGMDDEAALAGEAAAEARIDREMALLKDAVRRYALEPEEWQRSSMSSTTTFLTPDELDELRNDLQALVDRYKDRLADPALRPEGSREIRILAATTVGPQRPDKS